VAIQHWVQGDTTPLQMLIKDQTNAVVNLTGAAGKFYMRRQGAIANKVNGTAIVVTVAASGFCEYRWIGTDIDTAGTYDCEVEITDTAGYLLTTEPVQPFTLIVRKGLG